MRISDGSSDVCSSDRGVIDGDRRWTYAEFADRCDRQARLLTDELGVQRGDVVAWLCGNTHELLEAYYGVLLAGAVLLPLNIRLSPAELRGVLEQSRATVLFRDRKGVVWGKGVSVG